MFDFKNPLSIISEACETDDFNTEDLDEEMEDEYEGEILDDYDDFEELEESITYTEEMVNIIAQPTSSGQRYLMEYDSLAKYMVSSDTTDIEEAMKKVCESNNILFEDTCLLVESKQDMVEYLAEAKTKKRSKVKVNLNKKLKTTANFFKTVKNKGIKVVKKKNKSKSINFSK